MSTKEYMEVYTVIEGDPENGIEDYWQRIGRAFPHTNGNGFNIILNALPLNGKLVVKERKPKP